MGASVAQQPSVHTTHKLAPCTHCRMYHAVWQLATVVTPQLNVRDAHEMAPHSYQRLLPL